MTKDETIAALDAARSLVAALEKDLAGMCDCGDETLPVQPSASREWITTDIAANILRVDYSTVYRYARAGRIVGAIGPTGLWRYSRTSVEALAKRRR